MIYIKYIVYHLRIYTERIFRWKNIKPTRFDVSNIRAYLTFFRVVWRTVIKNRRHIQSISVDYARNKETP